MNQELGTRDVFQQLHARLTRVEEDMRSLRVEMNQRMDRLEARLDRLDQRFDQLQWRLIGLFVVTWVTVAGSVWLGR